MCFKHEDTTQVVPFDVIDGIIVNKVARAIDDRFLFVDFDAAHDMT